MIEERSLFDWPDETETARELALKAASDIATQAEFAALDAADRSNLANAAKRFDAIRHYAERALQVLGRLPNSNPPPDSVK